MNQFSLMGLLRLLLVLALLVPALQAYALQEVPRLVSPVTDLTATLGNQEQAVLTNKLRQFSEAKGSQVAVLIVKTTQPETIEQYANRVAMGWQLGRKKEQDGVLLLVATGDRKARIEVDSGLQGAIPDVYAKRMIVETLRPHFRRNDFYGGLDQVTSQIFQLIEGEDLPPPGPRARPVAFGDILPMVIIGGMFLGGILRAVFGNVLGGLVNGGVIGFFVYMFGAGLAAAFIFGFVAFIIGMAGGNMGGMGYGGYRGGYGGYGGRSSGGFDPWSGGGSQGWSGGGASGDW